MMPFNLAIACSLMLAVSAIAAEPGKAIGSAVAPITIELFSDFQCPHCKELHDETIGPLINEFVNRNRVFLVRRYYPLPSHAYAKPAAYLACAAEKMGKYNEVSNLLYRTQETWGANGKVEETVCSILKPDEAKRIRLLAKDPAVISEVDKDKALGDAQKITQTPTMIISHNGKSYPIPGAVSYPMLKRFLDDMLGQ